MPSLSYQLGYFQSMYRLLAASPEEELPALVLKHADWYVQQGGYLREVRSKWCRNIERNFPPLEVLTSLFSASVLNNLFIAQLSKVDDMSLIPFDLSTYQEMTLNWLGFDHRPVSIFHPFYCEIVEVIERQDTDTSGVQIIDCKWPCLMLGKLMFSRAGVIISAPKSSGYVRGVADKSKLFWCDFRANRPTHCPSHSWGTNSMWDQELRCDFETETELCYNQQTQDDPDRICLPLARKNSYGEAIEDFMPDMTDAERMAFIQHRCATTCHLTAAQLKCFDPYAVSCRSIRTDI